MKNERQSAIISIISDMKVKTHDRLVSELMKRGFNVTQATVSRDIKELCLIKNHDGFYCLSDSMSDHKGGSFIGIVKSIDFGGNMVVIKTTPGTAPAVAAYTDEIMTDDILGTIAGDDTIFVAVKESSKTESICKRLKILLMK